MYTLAITLFDRFQAELDGQLLDGFRTSKVQALLVYLVTEPEPHSRESLMELLWPGMPDRSARHNLRQVLYYLRRAIPEVRTQREDETEKVPLVQTNRQTIGLNLAADVRTDVSQFVTLVERTKAHVHVDLFMCSSCRQDLEEAVSLYRGDFLPDFYLDDSNEFEEWAQVKREAYRRLALDALEILATLATRREDYPEARSLAERQLEIDNLRESSYRQQMEVLALSGRREEALAVYEECRRVLSAELSMAPARRTTEIYEKILAGVLSFDTPQVQGVRGYEIKDEIGAGAHGSIHRAVQPAIGREVAVKVIRRRYANNPEFIRRFEEEMHILARLEHPFVVPLYDYWREPDGAYLVMRYLKGGSLLHALKEGPWEPGRAMQMLDQVASALTAAHQIGILHRDIKPANILLDESGNAFLSDFGIAKAEGRDPLTANGAVVGTPDYISPEQILNEEVSAQSDIYSLGAVMYEVLTGEKPFGSAAVANLLYRHLQDPIPGVTTNRPDFPGQIDMVLQRATAKRPSERYHSAQEMAADFRRAVMGASSATAVLPSRFPAGRRKPNPYKGLMAFQEADADDFYGREALVELLIARLRANDEHHHAYEFPGASGRFLALVGPSGSGKSSVVKAGLIPALRDGAIPGSDKWFVAEMVPSTSPLEELELALWPVAVDPPPDLVEPMRRDKHGLLRTLRRILPDEPGAQLLLFIDQFEELFTLVDSEEERVFFLDSLLTAIMAPHSPLRVVITLRADFYDRPLLYQSLGQVLKRSTEVILPMTAEELNWAIGEPARQAGVSLEDGLGAAIVAEVANQPGALPLLQYALTELFVHREGNLMTLAAYEEIGRVRGALARRAADAYAALEASGQRAARQLFLRLVTFGEGGEETRRRVLRSEVEGLHMRADKVPGEGESLALDTAELMSTVIDRFGEARLLTLDRDPESRRPTVVIAHEALLREWAELRGWLDEYRADMSLQQQLSRAAGEWRDSGREASYLLRGRRLAQFDRWDNSGVIALSGEELAFLEASLSAQEARTTQEEARRRRELLAAQNLAQSERERAEAEARRAEDQAEGARQLRRRALLLAGALGLALVLAILATVFAQSSRKQARLAQSRELAASSAIALDTDPELGILLALRAMEVGPTDEAEQALHMALITSRLRLRLAEHETPLQRVTLSPDGSLIAAAAHAEQAATVWESGSGQKRFDIPVARGLWGVHFSEEGQRVAAVQPGDSFSLGIYDVGSGDRIDEVTLPLSLGDAVGDVIFYNLKRDWSQAAVTLFGGEVSVWDLRSGERLFDLPGHRANTVEVEYDEDGERLVTADYTGLVIVWDAQTGEALGQFNAGEGVNDHSVSPDGHQVALARVVGGGSQVEIWQQEKDSATAAWSQVLEFPGIPNALMMVAYSSDGRYLASAGRHGTVRIWDLFEEEAAMVIPHLPGARSVAFHPNEAKLLTGDYDGAARVWDLSPLGTAETLTLEAHDGTFAVALGPDGRRLATAGWDGSGKIWDLASGEALQVLKGGGERLTDIAFHPQGRTVAASSTDGTVRTWDVATGAPLLTLEGHGEGLVGGLWPGALAVDYSPDGRRLVSAGADGTARVWDSERGEEMMLMRGLAGGLTIAQYGQEGQTIATGGGFNPIRFADAETGNQLLAIPFRSDSLIWAMDVSPDGRYLAIGDNDSTAQLWALDEDLKAADQLATLRGHNNIVVSVRFSPDGRTLATGDGTDLRLWDLGNLVDRGQDEIVSQRLLLPGGVSFAFSADGKELIAAGDDGMLRIYLLDRDRLISLARSRVTRQLTNTECQQYLHILQCPAAPAPNS